MVRGGFTHMTTRRLDMDLRKRLRELVLGDAAQDLIEYAMLAAILALGTVAATEMLGGSIVDTFWQRIAGMLNGIRLG